MKYITVLDFEAGRVFQYEIDFFPDVNVAEEYLSELGHNLKNCEWMSHDDNRIIVQNPHGEIKQLQSHYDITN